DHRSWLKNHEERLQVIEKQETRLNSITDHEKRIKLLEIKPAQEASKMFWLIAGGAVGMIVTLAGKLILVAITGG
ncbi:MAG: hypothetical protein L3J63_11815, partial [Geopsychrobacter sp.]|nr:hypothetical protein [Geopsychrobacter sp.]